MDAFVVLACLYAVKELECDEQECTLRCVLRLCVSVGRL